MNLLEALRTGKSLRRPIARHLGSCRYGWLSNEYVIDFLVPTTSSAITWLSHERYFPLNREDLFADDWEVKDETT